MWDNIVMPAGRPTKYTLELGTELCAELSLGKSLRTVCKLAKFPSVVTVFTWIREHDEFLKQYEKAKQESSDLLVEEMMDIADTKDSKESAQRSRLRVDTRKWVVSKLKPKKYGDKLDVTSDGEKLPTPIIKIDNALLSNNSNE